MFVAVYAICRNEAAFAPRWMSSMAEADGIYVLDTGSEDGTAALLRSLGAEVRQAVIDPWRFDTARNRSLALVPEEADICVCTDLDEVFRPGWRSALEAGWFPGTEQGRYRYTWSFTPEGREGVVFYSEKIHCRQGWQWVHPVHEVLRLSSGKKPVQRELPGVQLDHFPDKTKSRGQYLPLLELAVRERPEDDRNRHYLGREYLFRGMWDRCIETLQEHLAMPSARWRDERCASMRFIGRAFLAKGDKNAARTWFYRAVGEAPWLREPYMELAELSYRERDWEGVVFFTGKALSIEERGKTYIAEDKSWGALPWDLRSLGLFYTARREEAVSACREAVRLAPEDERLWENLRIMERE